ncbi:MULTISPECIES: hypothetical protein [unclassified Guyparkeria]|uniref:hypothetical protein n=1 Tax=unclassified Guyparkeria TaxID=2626246 RepID=UPI00073352AF|nr:MULTISPECIES: hypothetical protein [unclassified Guyparkeria]KTG17839.1 hypothetical protein AUR63_06905 [Guyparkeria sp. XI15]OAE89550.1 hypothetical protein AWR35_06915 [Guyparkeria sp. WRN-7]
MKKLLLATTIAGLSLGLSAPTMAEDDQYEAYQASVDERGDSGVSGTAIFDPENGQMTVVVNAENAEGMSVGIHRGVCRYAEDSEGAPENLAFNKQPEFQCTPFQDGQSMTTIDISIEELMGQPRSVVIYDGNTITACGNIQ